MAVRGQIVVPGGCGADGQAIDALDIYDPRADRWRRGASLPGAVCGYALAALNGEVFLFGGRSGPDAATARDAVWRYRLEDDAWREVGRLPQPRSDLAAAVDGERVHLVGGLDRGGRLQTTHWVFWPYDEVEERRWDLSAGAPLPEGRAGLSLAVSPVRSLYAIGGGWDRALAHGTLVLHLGVPGDAWSEDVDLPGVTPQRGAGAAVLGGRWLVLAGGEADGALLDRHYRREVVAGTLLIPGPGR